MRIYICRLNIEETIPIPDIIRTQSEKPNQCRGFQYEDKFLILHSPGRQLPPPSNMRRQGLKKSPWNPQTPHSITGFTKSLSFPIVESVIGHFETTPNWGKYRQIEYQLLGFKFFRCFICSLNSIFLGLEP